MRTVVIDPDGTSQSYCAVIVQHPTGVSYQQQCGGVECAQRSVEGYYVPLGGALLEAADGFVDFAKLTAVFHQGKGCRFGGSPSRLPPNTPTLPPDRLDVLRAVVATIPYWRSEDGPAEEHRVGLRLDEDRLGELLEAWVPVLTPDGPAILTWPNCD